MVKDIKRRYDLIPSIIIGCNIEKRDTEKDTISSTEGKVFSSELQSVYVETSWKKQEGYTDLLNALSHVYSSVFIKKKRRSNIFCSLETDDTEGYTILLNK